MKRRPCKECGIPRQEKFYKSERATVCSDCQRKRARRNSRNTHLVKTYGLTLDEYNALLDWQGGACFICQRKPRYQMDVDHDHKTGMIRGLLCKPCNRRFLPAVRDDVDTIRRGMLYLLEPPAVQVIGERFAIAA